MIYRHTQAEAVQALHLAQYDKLQGTLSGSRGETVEEYLLEWLEYRIQPKVREKTYQRYQELFMRHIFPTLGQISLRKLTPFQVQKLYQEKQRQGYSEQTIHQMHKLLHRAFSDAVQLHYTWRNVCLLVTVPRLPRTEKNQALTVEQARHLLAAASGDPLEALYVLVVTTGMREGELLGLQWADLDWISGKIQVRGRYANCQTEGWCFLS